MELPKKRYLFKKVNAREFREFRDSRDAQSSRPGKKKTKERKEDRALQLERPVTGGVWPSGPEIPKKSQKGLPKPLDLECQKMSK